MRPSGSGLRQPSRMVRGHNFSKSDLASEPHFAPAPKTPVCIPRFARFKISFPILLKTLTQPQE